MVVTQALRLAGIGIATGLPLAFALSSALASALFGLVALDVSTFVYFTGLLAGVALISSYIPARAATRSSR